MPSTPIIFGLTFIFIGIIVKHSTEMRVSIFDNIIQKFLRISFNFGMGVVVNVYGQESAYLNHQFG
jgi:hypothetical protein